MKQETKETLKSVWGVIVMFLTFFVWIYLHVMNHEKMAFASIFIGLFFVFLPMFLPIKKETEK